MKLSDITIFITIVLSTNALSEIEYYHCESGADTFWKFDIDAINNKNISPFKKPKVRVRQLGSVGENSNVEVSDEWFKITNSVSGGLLLADIEIVTYINRKGGNSITQVTNPIFGDGRRDMGVCKNYIEGENLDTLFKMQSELRQEEKKAEMKRLKSLPPVKNWN